jgi:hypothetical protein
LRIRNSSELALPSVPLRFFPPLAKGCHFFPPWGLGPRVLAQAVQEQLRLAFSRWGLPGRFRVGNGWPWGALGDFPTELALWLIGLGVAMHWNNPRRPQENGVVERSQGTSARWCEPWTCRSRAELQARLERMDRLYREVYPYRERRSRLKVANSARRWGGRRATITPPPQVPIFTARHRIPCVAEMDPPGFGLRSMHPMIGACKRARDHRAPRKTSSAIETFQAVVSLAH